MYVHIRNYYKLLLERGKKKKKKWSKNVKPIICRLIDLYAVRCVDFKTIRVGIYTATVYEVRQ